MKRCFLLLSVAAALATSAGASAPPRCALLGQVATSAFLDFVTALSTGEADRISQQADLLDNITQSYATLSCDIQALSNSMDCLLESQDDQPARLTAQRCLQAEGLVGQR